MRVEPKYRCGCEGVGHEAFCFVAWQQMADAKRAADAAQEQEKQPDERDGAVASNASA